MQRRIDVWRKHLIGDELKNKRHLYHRFISGLTDVPNEIKITIKADMPRTYPSIEWIQNNTEDIETILTEYAAVHKADSYLQGFNYIVAIVLYVMKDEPEHKMADTFWCTAGIIGRIRPFVPDFNIAWFKWCERHWMKEFQIKLRKKRPQLSHILSKQEECLSKLIPCKWFLIWFAQTIAFDELFLLWDFFIQLPPQQLMKAYIMFTYEIFNERATYKWATVDASELLMEILMMKVENIGSILKKVQKLF